MTPQQAAQYLVGKTIKEVSHHEYLSWDFCIEAIEFTDGTVLPLSGNADNAHCGEFQLASGDWETVGEEYSRPNMPHEETKETEPNPWELLADLERLLAAQQALTPGRAVFSIAVNAKRRQVRAALEERNAKDETSRL